MIKFSQGKIKLEDRIIDLSRFEIRPKVTESDLERHYDSFIEHAEEIGDYFEDRGAFDKALKDASGEKRPKLIPREPKYPSMLQLFNPNFSPFDFLEPKKRRLDKGYFVVAHCMASIPRKNQVEAINLEAKWTRPLDGKLREDIAERFKQFPGYEGIIEIPNDRTQPETKSTTFHESLHYLILRYQAETERNFVNTFGKGNLSQLERYQAEYLLHERVVGILTEKLLVHDKDALLENRWIPYSLSNQGFRVGVTVPLALGTGLILASSISHPYLLPLALVPGRIRDFMLEKYKNSKKEELTKPIEYPEFKI